MLLIPLSAYYRMLFGFTIIHKFKCQDLSLGCNGRVQLSEFLLQFSLLDSACSSDFQELL